MESPAHKTIESGLLQIYSRDFLSGVFFLTVLEHLLKHLQQSVGEYLARLVLGRTFIGPFNQHDIVKK